MSTAQLVQCEFDFNQQHTERKYTMTEKVIQAKKNQTKQFELSPMNSLYINAFRNAKYPEWETDQNQKASWAQYKCSIGNFLEIVGKDAVIIKTDDITNFINQFENEKTKANKIAHIKSFLSFLIKNNIANCHTRVSRETLILIVSM
jgi:ATP-dependent 26S proteasome regulatory subunit